MLSRSKANEILRQEEGKEGEGRGESELNCKVENEDLHAIICYPLIIRLT